MKIKKKVILWKEKAGRIKEELPALFLSLKRKETPVPAKILAAIILAYALSPIDLIPDVIPIFGFLDDVILLPLLITLVIKMIPETILRESRIQAADLRKGSEPRKWYYAIPVLLIWLIAALMLMKVIIRFLG